MDLQMFLSCATFLHLALYSADYILKKSENLRRRTFLQQRNISINLFQVKWWTSSWNPKFLKLGKWKSRFWDVWFYFGTWLTILLLGPSVFLLLRTLVTSVSNIVDEKNHSETMLQPVLPGVNLPSSEIIYYLLTLLICSVIHEAGHALAAVRQNISLMGVGLFLVFILPAAFVDLPSREMNSLTPWQQLSVYCGGVWHNLALASFSYLLLLSVPVLSTPMYSTGNGIYILDVYQSAAGLNAGDQVTRVDECLVRDVDSWRRCLSQVLQEPPRGFCVQPEVLNRAEPSNSPKCCPDEFQESHLCFEGRNSMYSCERARNVVETSSSRCLLNVCEDNKICVFPVEIFGTTRNRTKLIQVRRTNDKDVLFYGDPAELYSSVYVTSYLPRFILSPRIVNFIESLLKYVVSFSAGLAVLNIVPSFALDGQHIVKALCHCILPNILSKTAKNTLIHCIVVFGSVVLFLNVVLGMYVVLKT